MQCITLSATDLLTVGAGDSALTGAVYALTQGGDLRAIAELVSVNASKYLLNFY